MPLHLQGTEDGGQAVVKAHIHHRPDHLRQEGGGAMVCTCLRWGEGTLSSSCPQFL
jgi:hypothetical protein